MVTKLEGPDTVFLPFNKGDDGGAGNPLGKATASGNATRRSRSNGSSSRAFTNSTSRESGLWESLQAKSAT